MSIYMYRPNMNKLCCLNILFYKFHGRYYQRSFVPRPIHMKNIFPCNIFPHFVFFYNLPTYFINETAGRCTLVQYSPYYYLEENLSGKISVFFILTLPWKNIVKKKMLPLLKSTKSTLPVRVSRHSTKLQSK